MSDVPYYPTAGAAALTGAVPTVLAGGLTVFAPEAGTWGQAKRISSKALAVHLMTRTLTVHNITLNIKTAMGYLPPDVTVVAFGVRSADLDGAGPTLVQSLYIDSTVVLTGITTGQAGTYALYPCLPTLTVGEQVVYLNTTTSATTPAEGEVTVAALYYA